MFFFFFISVLVHEYVSWVSQLYVGREKLNLLWKEEKQQSWHITGANCSVCPWKHTTTAVLIFWEAALSYLVATSSTKSTQLHLPWRKERKNVEKCVREALIFLWANCFYHEMPANLCQPASQPAQEGVQTLKSYGIAVDTRGTS